jgi:hypothetical protein
MVGGVNPWMKLAVLPLTIPPSNDILNIASEEYVAKETWKAVKGCKPRLSN